jgi:zinc protease
MKLDELKAFHRDFYGAEGQLAVVGDFDPKAVEAQVTKLFGDWKAVQPFARIPQRLKEGVAPLDAKLETPDKAQAIFIAALPMGLKDGDPDYAALLMGNYMLGGGAINSRIANRLRQKDGLSYGAGSQFNAGSLDAVGQWAGFAIYAPQNLAKLESAFNEELALALKDGFKAEELEAAKTSWLQGQATSRSQDRELAGRLSQNLFAGRAMAWYGELETKVKALTADQVLAALRRHLDPAKLHRVKAGDFAKPAAK